MYVQVALRGRPKGGEADAWWVDTGEGSAAGTLGAVTADRANPELGPAVVALDEGERDPAMAASAHDAFVGLAVPVARGFVAEAGALLVGTSVPAGELSLGPDTVWGAVGVTATRGLVLVSGERGRVASSVAEENPPAPGVVRAVAGRGTPAPPALPPAHSLTPGPPEAPRNSSGGVLPGP